jgi:hypothetical protein
MALPRDSQAFLVDAVAVLSVSSKWMAHLTNDPAEGSGSDLRIFQKKFVDSAARPIDV